MESMAIGIPVIATKGGGTPEIINNGINGIIVESNNVNEIVNHVNLLFSDNNLLNKLSINSKKTILKTFNLENTTEQYIKLYHSV
jgi:glycosyltransferase involved in cell wall biosynthesis